MESNIEDAQKSMEEAAQEFSNWTRQHALLLEELEQVTQKVTSLNKRVEEAKERMTSARSVLVATRENYEKQLTAKAQKESAKILESFGLTDLNL